MENRLKDEKSLYLRRHAENPVPWQKWGREAFELAAKLKRPVFLSSGYSSCHWCRVMEAESFSDEETARILAGKFVSIKLDRDEYPDVDKEFQFYLQSTGEPGGWPLTVFMTPEKEPFYAGTYFPKKSAADKPSFRSVLENVYKIYSETPEKIDEVVEVRKNFMASFLTPAEIPADSADGIEEHGLSEFKKIFDKEYGGFREGAKFPYIPAMSYLCDAAESDGETADFLVRTADALCAAPICDHLYGGFFRYSVDRKWMRPHFEKMLSDNAQIPRFLLKMYELTENRLYLMTAKKGLDFAVGALATPYGMLNSLDADSVNQSGLLEEGYYYKVTDRDFSVLSEGELKNFPADAGVENGLIYLKTPEYLKAAALQPTLEKIARRTSSVKTPPLADTKALSGPNFMFVSALADCFEISGEEWYLSQATAFFQKTRHLAVDGAAVYRGVYGEDAINHRVLEDHVYYLEAALRFFDITQEKEFVRVAEAVAEEIEKTFVKDGMPYLDTNKRIFETFDDDKPNPATLYTYLLQRYGDVLSVSPSENFLKFAFDRAVKYPTGHPTILKTLPYLNAKRS